MNKHNAYRPEPSKADSASDGLGSVTELQHRVSVILDEYLTELEAGHLPDEQAIIDANPDLRQFLQPHFSNLRMLQGFKADSNDDHSLQPIHETPQELGDYKLQREIARGGMGIVFEAVNKTLQRKVALKVLPFAAVLNQKQIDRFRNEAQAAACLHHPNIVPIYSVGVDRGVHYYAMQFIEGRSLSEALDNLKQQFKNGRTRPDTQQDLREKSTCPWLGPLECDSRPAEIQVDNPGLVEDSSNRTSRQTYGDADYFHQVAKLGIEVTGAMHHAHSLGIIHRDIKPSNLLVDQNGKAWVADFGLAHIPNDLSMTKSGDVLGTIRYMSPEQAAGNRFVDHRTDIYSIGITLYELLTLRAAFDSEDSATFLRQISETEPPNPRKLNRAIPQDLENIVLKAIAKEPADRYDNADDLAEDLRRFANGHPTLAKQPTFLDRTNKWVRRHHRLVAAAAIMLCLLFLGTGTATVLLMSERAKTQLERQRTADEQLRTRESLKKAREIVDNLGTKISEDLASLPGAENTRLEVLNQTHQYYQFLISATNEVESSSESIRWDQAVARNNAGKIAKQLGDSEAALEAFRSAREILMGMPQSYARDQELARCLNDEGLLLAETGQIQQGLERLDDALSIQNALLTVDVEDSDHRSIYSDFACTQGNRAFLYSQQHEFDASREAYQSAITWHRKSLRKNERSLKSRRLLALSIHNLAQVLVDSDPKLARRHCMEAIQIQEQLRRERPANILYQSDLALSYRNLAGFWAAENAWGKSITTYQKAIAIQLRLVSVAPAIVDYQSDLAITYNNLGEVELRSENESGSLRALEAFTNAEKLLRQLVELDPNDVSYQSSLGGALYNKGEAQLALNRKPAAIASWRAGLAHQKDAVLREPHAPQFREFLAIQTRRLQEMGEQID